MRIYINAKMEVMTEGPNRSETIRRCAAVGEWWGSKKLSDVNAATCREYVQHRGAIYAARRELEDLRAAINHHAAEGLHRAHIKVTLPEKPLPRERWLTRSEMARLLWVCWRTREAQGGPDGGRYPWRHLVPFILTAAYTGTRSASVLAASFDRGAGLAYIDLDASVFYRLPGGKRATKKRQPPVAIPDVLAFHMRRWARHRSHLVTWNGQPVTSIKKAFAKAVAASGLEDVSAHTLRHTAATWLMQNGAEFLEAAEYLGMSVKVLMETYGHHHPGYLRRAANLMGKKPKERA